MREGLALYRAQPIGMIGISSFAPMFSLLLLMLPYVGQSLALLVFPFLIAALLETAKATAQTGRPNLDAYIKAWRVPAVRLRLLQLGVLYALIVGLLGLLLPGEPAPAASGGGSSGETSALLMEAAVMAALTVPFQMLVLFATALIARHGQSMPKAVFFAWFALWRNLAAILVNLLSVAMILLLFLMGLGALVELLGLSQATVQMLVLPLLFCILPIGVGSSYAMVCGVIQEALAPDAQAGPT